METVTEFTDAGEKTVERKVFPGYVLIKMILTDDSWHLVHNVRGATGFVGADGNAIPLTEQEIYDLGVELTARWRALSAAWKSLMSMRIPSMLLFPCSAEKLPSTWSLIRSKRSLMSDL